MPKPLRETATITEAAAAQAASSGRMLVQFINPGWGSSGYYSADVLEQAVTDQVIPAGTHMYADHPTDAEHAERPVRSIKDLMAVTTEDARLSEDGALVGEVQVVSAWRDLVETVKDSIGVSIRGSATDIVEGEAEGRSGGIIEGLVAPVMSVDFVTRAGRGGKVLSVLESARANKRALAHGISEATVNDTREALQTSLRDSYGNTSDEGRVWVYVRDFDATTVWFEVEAYGDHASNVDTGLFGQSYTYADGVVTLTGERAEVRVVTHYVSVTRPDSTNPTTEADQEVTMGNIQIEESVHNGLVEKAGRVDALESENVALKEAAATRVRTDTATSIIEARATEAQVEFTPLERRGLLSDLPLTEAGALDETAFTTAVDEAAAERKQAAGDGKVRGFGNETSTAVESDTGIESAADLDKALAESLADLMPTTRSTIKEA